MIKRPLRRIFTAILILLCMLSTFSISFIPAEALPLITPPPVFPNISDISGDFTDPNFRQAVWEWLGNSGSPGIIKQSTINDRLASGNKVMFLSGKNIASLNGLQHLEGMVQLTCDNNRLTSIPYIPTTLTTLICNKNSITSLPALPNGITWLDCSENQLTSLPALSGNMVILNCSKNQITSLPALPNTLQSLDCMDNKITSLPGLPNSLLSLICSWNELSSLPNLPSGLQGISCRNNQINSLPPLPTTLGSLSCEYNQISILPDLPNHLIIIGCGGNILESLPELPGNLSYLECADNRITNLPTLPDGIDSLICSNNQIVALPSLPNSLTRIDCDKNQLSTLPALPAGLFTFKCQYNYINVFQPSMATLLNKPGFVYKPQCRLGYTGSSIELQMGEARMLNSSDIKNQMSADGIVWGDVNSMELSKLTFSSSNNTVAKVDSTGLITGVGEGNCTIYAILSGVESALTKLSLPVVCTSAEKAYGEASSYAITFLDQAANMEIIPDRLKGKPMNVGVTREEFAEMAVLFYEKVTGRTATVPAGKTFIDTDNPEVLKAYGLNITAGVGDGTKFEPNTMLMRQQMATMITKTLKACYSNIVIYTAGQPNFVDQHDFAAYAIEPAKFMAKYTITVGDGHGSFSPKTTCTREQTFIFLVKSYNFRNQYIYE